MLPYPDADIPSFDVVPLACLGTRQLDRPPTHELIGSPPTFGRVTETAAGRTMLSRVTRVRALTYLLHEVRGLRARARREEATHSYPVDVRSNQTSSAMRDALAIEEGLLVCTLKIVRRVPDPAPRLTVGQIR